MSDRPDVEVDRLLSGLRATLDEIRTAAAQDTTVGGADPAEASVELLSGNGQALGGQIRATVTTGGRLADLVIDARARRLSAEELAEHILLAVNDAHDQLAEAATSAPVPGTVDLDALSGQLREVQDQGVRQMAAYFDSMRQMLNALQRRT